MCASVKLVRSPTHVARNGEQAFNVYKQRSPWWGCSWSPHTLILPRVCESHTLVLSVYVGKSIESSNVTISMVYFPLSCVSWSVAVLHLVFVTVIILHSSPWNSQMLQDAFCLCRTGMKIHGHQTFSNESLKPRKVKRLAQVHLVCGRLILAWVSQLRIELSFYSSKMLSLCTHPRGDFCQNSY